MTALENSDVQGEAVAPTETENVSQTQEMAYGNEAQGYGNHSEGQPEDDKAANFKAIRESNARLQKQYEESERERRAYADRLAKLERALEAQATPPTQEEIDELADLAKDDWTTREAVEKLAERKAKALYKQLREEDEKKRLDMERKRQIEEMPKKLLKQYPDFESVVTKENVEYLKANKPHIAASLAATTDPYAQALAAYDAVKAFCPNVAVRDEQERMDKNASKPGTLGAAKGSSPLAEAKMYERGLTPDLRKKLQAEMVAATRAS